VTKKKCNCDEVCETLIQLVENGIEVYQPPLQAGMIALDFLNYLAQEGRLLKCGGEPTSTGSGDSELSSDHF